MFHDHNSLRIGFHCDVGADVGTGHMARCLALAEEFTRRGVTSLFFAAVDDVSWLADRVDAAGHLVTPPPSTPDEIVAVTAEHDIDAWVIDSYTLDSHCSEALRSKGIPVLAIIDGDTHWHLADIYLDQNLGAEPLREPHDAVWLTGVQFALLSDAVRDRRPTAPRFRHLSHRDLGVRFTRGGRGNRRLRELFIHHKRTMPRSTNFWPLRHVAFDIKPGESVGVLGSNGTGKSTLLRLITGVLIPDEGHIIRRGGVAPLIALSAGFMDDLTGRENVELVAGMHGMNRRTIAAKFDEMVAFAEIDKFIDSPLRHYSSGMRVRLGFAVITQLDHPILLVDEALAVGDARFRRKCHGIIDRLLTEGKTLVLVSHNDSDLKRFCRRGLYLNAGELRVDGPIQDALDAYHEAAAPSNGCRSRRSSTRDP